MSLISIENELEIISTINRLALLWKNAPAMILTEYDLQAHLFAELNKIPAFRGAKPTASAGILGTSVHCELSWFDANGMLKIRPDITILEPEGLSITENFFQEGLPLPSKGFIFAGQAYLLEIKFHRYTTPYDENFIKGIKKDFRNLQKLLHRFKNENLANKIFAFIIIFDRSKNSNIELINTLSCIEEGFRDSVRILYFHDDIKFFKFVCQKCASIGTFRPFLIKVKRNK